LGKALYVHPRLKVLLCEVSRNFSNSPFNKTLYFRTEFYFSVIIEARALYFGTVCQVTDLILYVIKEFDLKFVLSKKFWKV